MRRIAIAIAASSLAVPCRAAPELSTDLSISTYIAKPIRPPIQFSFEPSNRPQGRHSIGLKGGLSEGKPLEVMVWGSGGAVAGSLAGPPGALIGAGVGAALGLLYSLFVVPHNGPEKAPASK